MPFGSFQNEERKIFMGTVLQILNFFRNRRIFVAKAICKVFTTAESALQTRITELHFQKKETSLCQALEDGLIQIEGCFVEKNWTF